MISAFCVLSITAKLWLNTILHHDIGKMNKMMRLLKNQAVVEHITHKMMTKEHIMHTHLNIKT